MNTTNIKYLLIILTVLGIILPYIALVPFIAQHGFDLQRLLGQAVANRIAVFAWLDVIVSAVVLLVVAFTGKLIGLKQACTVAIFTCLAGVSAGLPLFFYFLFANKKSN